MRVYRWKKPTVNITKWTGWTFTPGTYYVWWYWIINHWSYTGYYYATSSSPRPDVQTVVLWAGETSITVSLSASWWITAITNAWWWKIQITSQLHCLDVGNIITILWTTNYNGTYTITDWVDYNNFKVTATYVANETWTRTINKRNCNWATHIAVYVNNVYPFDANGDYINVAGNNHCYFDTTDTIVMNSYTSPRWWYVNLAGDCNKLTYDCKSMINYGVPYLKGTETTTTNSALTTEVANAWLSEIAQFITRTSENYNWTWYVWLNMEFPNLVMTITNYKLNFLWLALLPKTTIKNSFVNKIWFTWLDTYNYSIRWYWDFDVDNSSLEWMRNLWYINIINPINSNVVVKWLLVSNMSYMTSASASTYNWHDDIGKTRTIENINIYNWSIWVGTFYNIIPALKNTNFLSEEPLYDINFYGSSASYSAHWININTAREDNLLLIAPTYPFSTVVDFTCYRQKNIYIYDKSWVAISWATITITQWANTYTCTTDSNWYAQTPLMREQDCIRIAGTTGYNNIIYYDRTMTVRKPWYETYKSASRIARNIEEEITLKPSKPVLLDDSWNLYINTDKENMGNTVIIWI